MNAACATLIRHSALVSSALLFLPMLFLPSVAFSSIWEEPPPAVPDIEASSIWEEPASSRPLSPCDDQVLELESDMGAVYVPTSQNLCLGEGSDE